MLAVIICLDYAMASLAGDQAKCFRYLEECVVSQIVLRSSQNFAGFMMRSRK